MKDNTMKKWQPYKSLIEQEIELQYFNDGYLYNKTCKIKRIDPIYRSILLDDNSKLSLEDIVDIID